MCTASPPEPRALVPFSPRTATWRAPLPPTPDLGGQRHGIRPDGRPDGEMDQMPPRTTLSARRRASARQSGGDDRAPAGALRRRAPRCRGRPCPVRRAGRQRQRHASRVPPRRPGQWQHRGSASLLRPATTSRRVVRSTRRRTEHAARQLEGRPLGEHRHGSPRRRHRATARASRHRTVDRVRGLLGLGARGDLRRASPRACVGGRSSAAFNTGTADDIDWLTVHAGRFFPAEWHAFRDHVPVELRGMRLVDAYHTLLMDPDPAVREAAAVAWCRWEDAHVATTPGASPNRALRGRRVPARLRPAGHPLLAQQLVARPGRDRSQRRPVGGDPRMADPRPSRREQSARRTLAAPPGLAGQRTDRRRRRGPRRDGDGRPLAADPRRPGVGAERRG